MKLDDKGGFPSVWKFRGLKNYEYIGGSAVEVFALRLNAHLCVVVRTNAPNMIAHLFSPDAYKKLQHNAKLENEEKPKKKKAELSKATKRARALLKLVEMDDFFFTCTRDVWCDVKRVKTEEGQQMFEQWLLLKNI